MRMTLGMLAATLVLFPEVGAVLSAAGAIMSELRR